MARPAPSSRGQLHVGRYLGALLGIVVLLYAVVFLAGPGNTPLTPKLGLDLQGGSSVILEAKPPGGKAATAAQLSTAVDIIRQRVNGAGVSEAEVVVQGQNIVVSVPGGNRSSIKNVTQTAQLRFREVLDSAAGAPAPPQVLTPNTPAPSAAPSAAAPTPAASAAPSPAASPAASPPAAAKPGAPPSGPTVKIGVLTPLSPPGDAAAGQLIVRGADLAAEYVNQRLGGIISPSCQLPGLIELVKADDSGTPEKGVAAFRKLVQDDKVAGVMGQFHSSVTLALGPVADQLKVPVISTQSSAADITAKHYEYMFQTHSITTDRAAAVADFIKTYGFKKVAIVAENTDYGTGNTEELKSQLANSGVELRDWVFDNKSTDISPLLLQVKAFDPDLIYNLGVGAPAYLVIKQSYDTGLMPKAQMLVSYDAPIRPEFWQNLGERGKGIIFVSYYHPRQALSDAGKWMQAEYEKRFNEPALYSSFAAFGNVLELAQAINQACSTDGPAVAKALETGKFVTWNQTGVSFPRADGADWHRVKQPLLLIQYTEVNQNYGQAPILYPSSMKTGDLQRNP